MSTDLHNRLINKATKVEAAPPLTPEQVEAYEAFAGKALIYMDEINALTSFGMVPKHVLNQKFNYLVRDGKLPGGYIAAVTRMEADGLIYIRQIGGNSVAVLSATKAAVESKAQYPGDPCHERYGFAWKSVKTDMK